MAEDAVGGKAKKNRKARPKSGKPKDEEEIPLADLEGSKSKFDLLLQQAVGQTTEGIKKKKKKKGDAEAVLESLRKGEGLQKEEDAAIKANTYDPDNSPKNEKSNKRRQRMQEKGKDNTAYEKEKDSLEMIDETKGVGKKKKKPKRDDIVNQNESTETISPKEDKTMTMSELEATPTKKKKKKKPPDMEDKRPLSPEEPTTKGERKKKKKNVPVEEERAMSPEQEEGPISPKSAGKKKKKKSELDRSEEEQLLSQSEEITSPKEEKKKKKKKEEVKSDEERPLSPSEESVTSKGKKKKKKTEGDESRPMSPASEAEQTEGTGDKKKKKKKKTEEGDESAPMSPVSEEEQAGTSTEKKKKKKKKAKQEGDEEEEQPLSEGEETVPKEEDEDETEAKSTAKKKGKKKKKDDIVDEEAENERRQKREGIEDEGQILAITIHRTDKLKNDFHIMHPLVRVHVIDEDTGTYLHKQSKERPVTAYFETMNKELDKILPIMTQPFDFKQKKSVLPVWEELLLFNENFNYFIQSDPKVIVFFELLDFVSMNTASRQYSSNKSEGGWHRIAWAFLKVVGNNNKLNAGAKVRLQLFVPPYSFTPQKGQAEVYQWWKTQKREPYPSTLYVTLKGITPPDSVEPAMRSMFATQEEVGSRTYDEMKRSITWGEKQREGVRTLSSWSRLVGQTCRIPNNLCTTLSAGRKGCYILQFSHDGRSLACACHDNDQYPILVYEIPSYKLLGKLKGHFGIVYDLSWSKRDTHLLTASSDGTTRVWNMETFTSEKLLPHPAFVYTAQFHSRVDTVIATGGYDQVIRVWDVGGQEPHGILKQEIEDHRGHVNSLCFDDDGQKMYSADSVGNIIIWNVFVTEQISRPDNDSKTGFMRDWTIYQKVLDPELKDVPINHLQLHHSGRRLLVHCRDNIIRMVDLRVQRVMQKYIGHVNFREHMKSSLSPCGSFVFAGSEDNFAYAWNTETGDQVAMYTELNYRHPVTDAQYHPRDHLLALCSIGDNQPIIIYNYDPHIAQIDAGLSPRTIMTEPKLPDDTTLSTLGSPKKGEETLGLSSKVLTKDEFQAHATARFEKVMKKLNSATTQMISTPVDLPGMPSLSPRLAHTGFMSMDQSMTPRAMMATPQSFTPHGKRSFSTIMQQQQFASQNLYLKSADSDWRPGFSEVGRYGARSSSPTFIGRPPTLSLSNQYGKPQFSFQAAAGKAVPSYKQVVALYDYRAQRSDELTIFKGDVISVLYKDNDNWWMGELPDGKQGFFPANYVAEEMKEDMSNGRPIDDSTDEDVKKSLTAVKTKNGELKFLSGNEDSDEEMLESAKSDKKKKGSRSGSHAGSVDSKGSTGKRHVTINESNA